MPEQVQDFYPTPSTISTCMYYTGVDPRTMKKVYTPVNPHEKAMQRALIQYKNPKNYDLVKEALIKAGREDLIGFDEKCLIRPRKEKWREEAWEKKSRSGSGLRSGEKSGTNDRPGKKANGCKKSDRRNTGLENMYGNRKNYASNGTNGRGNKNAKISDRAGNKGGALSNNRKRAKSKKR